MFSKYGTQEKSFVGGLKPNRAIASATPPSMASVPKMGMARNAHVHGSPDAHVLSGPTPGVTSGQFSGGQSGQDAYVTGMRLTPPAGNFGNGLHPILGHHAQQHAVAAQRGRRGLK
jgi:hypothetical protein